jgi:hypothetical protein
MAVPKARADADRLIDELIRERPVGRYGSTYNLTLDQSQAGKAILALNREEQARIVEAAAARVLELERRLQHELKGASRKSRDYCKLILWGLLRRKLPLDDAALVSLLDWIGVAGRFGSFWIPLAGIATAVENRTASGPLDESLRAAIARAEAKLREYPSDADCRKTAGRLIGLIQDEPRVPIEPGEAWSDAALSDLEAMPAGERRCWQELLAHCQPVSEGKPAARWLKEAGQLVQAVGADALTTRLIHWFALVDKPRTRPAERRSQWEPDWGDLIQPPHVDLLKGLAWCAGLHEDRGLARALTALALSAYRKLPGKGPRLVALGNAAVAGLGMMPGTVAVGQLALLKVKVKFGTAQKEVEKALDAAATRAGLPRAEIEELGVPGYGLEEVGRRREQLGDYVAELTVDGSDVAVHWSRADGKPFKSAPAAVKQEHAEDVKELQAAAKDAARMLAAQRERLDGLFLARRSWSFEAWRERYLDHPLVGTIARRLIWEIATGERTIAGIWHDGRVVDPDDRVVEALGPGARLSLWHPIGHAIDDVLAWRGWLERHGVRQPFKQAHREVYVLTDAERTTRVYSNRFAAHVLRQHQFHALCAARGWRNKLRLMVDDTYPPATRALPEWGLRAECWIEGIGGDHRTDINESGVYLYVATDQVRFYPLGAPQRHAHAGGGGYSRMTGSGWPGAADEPIPLDEVPPLVVSEILRDVDLFVGVASVGNEPSWFDGGPDGRFVDYWQRYSFGELSATAQTRKTVLERLIPRLKIAPRCTFADRFLIVRGDLRTYKIHLGSGNILMEPNDQYLCIVPKQAAGTAGTRVFLPFEGDSTLAIILSKALLLAEDTKVTDPTITRQIGR